MKAAIIVCAVLVAGWMTFDGARALLTGDYVTPSSGDHAGQLGPWAGLVQKLGIEPRSTGMKLWFLLYGLGWLTVTVCYWLNLSWAPAAMLIMAICALWYLPWGTLLGFVQIVLLAIRHYR